MQTFEPLNTQRIPKQLSQGRTSTGVTGLHHSFSLICLGVFGSLLLLCLLWRVFYRSGCHSSLSSMVMPTSATWSLTERMQSWFTMPLLGCQVLLVIPHHCSVIFQVAIQLVEVQGLRTERIRLVSELRVKVDAS